MTALARSKSARSKEEGVNGMGRFLVPRNDKSVWCSADQLEPVENESERLAELLTGESRLGRDVGQVIL